MMSIVENYGRRGATKKESSMATRPVGQVTGIPMPQQSIPHERHAQSIAYVSDLVDENAALHDENARLRADLNLANLRIRDLEKIDDERRETLERYRCSAVELSTHMDTISTACRKAHEAAVEVVERHTAAERTKKQLDLVETDLKKVAETFGAGDKDQTSSG